MPTACFAPGSTSRQPTPALCSSTSTAAGGYRAASNPTMPRAACWPKPPAHGSSRSTTGSHPNSLSPHRYTMPTPHTSISSTAPTSSAQTRRASLSGATARAGIFPQRSRLRARDDGKTPPAAQLLIYPATDFHEKAPSRTTFGEGFFLTEANMNFYESSFLGSNADRLDPMVSPLRAPDATGLPPAIVITAGFDPLRDEGEVRSSIARQRCSRDRSTLSRVHPRLRQRSGTERRFAHRRRRDRRNAPRSTHPPSKISRNVSTSGSTGSSGLIARCSPKPIPTLSMRSAAAFGSSAGVTPLDSARCCTTPAISPRT